MINVNKQLAQDFTDEVFKVLRETPDCDIYKAIEIAAKRPAPQFYISSFNRTVLYITRLLHGKTLPISNPQKVAQYEEIYRRYLPRHAGKRVNLDTLAAILNEPAPSWYRVTSTLLQLFYKNQRHKL